MLQVLAARVLHRPRDLDAAVTFYEEQLGLVRFREWGVAPHRGIVYFLGGGYLELTETPADARPPTLPAGIRLWLQVADAFEAEQALRAAGVAIVAPAERQPWGLVELVVRDPDGLELVVVSTPLDHPLRRRDPGT